MLLAWVDPHDLISVLEMSLHEVARETQLQEGEGYTISHLRGNRCFMEERMYRAQMEVSLFSKAMVNLCEEMTTRCRTLERCSQGYVQYSFLAFGSKMLHPTKAVGYVEACQAPSLVNFGCFRPTEVIQAKCNAWLLASSHSQDTIQVSDGEETLLASQQIQEIPQFHERLLCVSAINITIQHSDVAVQPNERFLFMPRSVKSLVDNVTYCAYMSACLAEINEPPDTNACDSFKTKEYWTLDTLKSNLHILDLKKQRAEAEMDMFYEAIERSSEFGSTNNGGHAAFTSVFLH